MDRLSHSEWGLMRICWRLERCTVRQVLKQDRHKPKRDYRTILTFMSRMANKGWLKVEKEGNTNYYTPAVPQEQAVKSEIRRFLDEVTGSEPEHLQLLQHALDRKAGRKRPRGKR